MATLLKKLGITGLALVGSFLGGCKPAEDGEKRPRARVSIEKTTSMKDNQDNSKIYPESINMHDVGGISSSRSLDGVGYGLEIAFPTFSTKAGLSYNKGKSDLKTNFLVNGFKTDRLDLEADVFLNKNWYIGLSNLRKDVSMDGNYEQESTGFVVHPIHGLIPATNYIYDVKSEVEMNALLLRLGYEKDIKLKKDYILSFFAEFGAGQNNISNKQKKIIFNESREETINSNLELEYNGIMTRIKAGIELGKRWGRFSANVGYNIKRTRWGGDIDEAGIELEDLSHGFRVGARFDY